jgi:hypothetical protein
MGLWYYHTCVHPHVLLSHELLKEFINCHGAWKEYYLTRDHPVSTFSFIAICSTSMANIIKIIKSRRRISRACSMYVSKVEYIQGFGGGARSKEITRKTKM